MFGANLSTLFNIADPGRMLDKADAATQRKVMAVWQSGQK
jgi:hypothetical protein